MKILPSYS